MKQLKLCVTPIICTLLRFLFTAQEQTWKRSLLRQRQNTKKRKRRRKSIILQLPRYVNERNSYTVFWQIRINSRTSVHFIVLGTCYTSFCFAFWLVQCQKSASLVYILVMKIQFEVFNSTPTQTRGFYANVVIPSFFFHFTSVFAARRRNTKNNGSTFRETNSTSGAWRARKSKLNLQFAFAQLVLSALLVLFCFRFNYLGIDNKMLRSQFSGIRNWEAH